MNVVSKPSPIEVNDSDYQTAHNFAEQSYEHMRECEKELESAKLRLDNAVYQHAQARRIEQIVISKMRKREHDAG